MSEHVPRVPTEGWLRSELERIGVPNRGTAWTREKLVAALRARGYEVFVSQRESQAAGGKMQHADDDSDR